MYKWFESINISRDNLFVTNIVKCIPSKQLSISHIQSCLGYIETQIEIIKPSVIITLGQVAISSVLKRAFNLENNHGQLLYYNNIPLFPLFDPHIVNNNQLLKKSVWLDLKKIREFIDGKVN